MKEETRERLVDSNIWMRGLFMVLFMIAFNIAELLIALVAIFQFFSALITGKVNEPLLRLGNNLSFFAFEALQFLTFNSEERPFPFAPWPDEEPGGELWRQDSDVLEDSNDIEASNDLERSDDLDDSDEVIDSDSHTDEDQPRS